MVIRGMIIEIMVFLLVLGIEAQVVRVIMPKTMRTLEVEIHMEAKLVIRITEVKLLRITEIHTLDHHTVVEDRMEVATIF